MAERAKALRWVGPVVPPVLLAAYPLVSLFEQNQTELPLSVIWSPLAVTAAVIGALYVVLLLVLKQPSKAGALTSLAVIVFFYWDTFKSDLSGLHLSNGALVAIWLVLFVAAAVLLLHAGRGLGNLMLALSILAVVLAGVPALKVASYQRRHPAVRVNDPRLWAAPLAQPAGAARPDIYVIVPDDYARADVLKRYFRYDNSAFLGQLKRRGFVVSDQARSAYSDSESNIAAELNMSYLTGLPRILGQKSQDVRPLKTLMKENRAARLLKPLGYRFAHIDSDEVTYAGGNPDISSVATPDSFTSLWLRKSVLRLVGGPVGFDDGAANQRFRDAVNTAFSRLAALPGQPSPKLVVFHTLMPHDPYIFGANGQSVTFPGHSDVDLAAAVGRAYYLRQLQFTSRKLLEAVDAIRARSKRPPVIVIQSDEGFQANDQPFGEAAMRDMRVKGLLAIYLPGVRNVQAPQPPTTINTLRYVFNREFGTRYPMLKAASYPEGDFPYQWQEMTVR